MAGTHWDRLSDRDRLDLTEAALLEPAVHAGMDVESALEALHAAIARAAPDLTSEEKARALSSTSDARRRTQAAYDMFGAGRAPRRRRQTVPQRPQEPAEGTERTERRQAAPDDIARMRAAAEEWLAAQQAAPEVGAHRFVPRPREPHLCAVCSRAQADAVHDDGAKAPGRGGPMAD